jgi:hypothetical protein
VKIYRLAWPEGYEFLNPVEFEDGQALQRFGSGAAQLPPVEVRLERSHKAGGKDHLRPSDFPWLSGQLVCSKRAAAALLPILELHGKLVPLHGAGGAFCALDVRVRLNALDFDHCLVERFESGRIMAIESYAFRLEAIAGWAIFKDREWDEVFVTQEYADAVADTGLPGAEFELLAEL